MNPADPLSYITYTLRGAAQAMSDTDRAMSLDCWNHWRSECERLKPEDPLRVAFTVHCEIDTSVQNMRATSKHAREIQCTKGCAACCHTPVHIHAREAALLLAVAEHDGIEIDEARLARQAAKSDDTWRELAPEDRACVFLAEDRTCRVYEHRPGACRKYFVKTAPELCDMVKYPGGQVGIVFSVEAEIIHSAAMTTYGAGGMAAMLLRTRRENNT